MKEGANIEYGVFLSRFAKAQAQNSNPNTIKIKEKIIEKMKKKIKYMLGKPPLIHQV